MDPGGGSLGWILGIDFGTYESLGWILGKDRCDTLL